MLNHTFGIGTWVVYRFGYIETASREPDKHQQGKQAAGRPAVQEEKVSIRIQQFVALSVWLLLAACGDRAMPTSPDARFDSNGGASARNTNQPGAPSWQSSSSSGGTVKETLTGPALNGVVPEGLAIADQSQFSSGGSTILTVQVKNVNLPDGTVLGVTLDFMPIGSITLSDREGSMSANLGHFAVSRDQVRVKNGDATILQGGFFR